MKKKTIIILSTIFIILLLAACIYLSKPFAKPPERLANVPKQTSWVGGADGGSWFQITKAISKNTFKMKIYNEVTGQPEIDTTFILSPDCSFKEIDSLLLAKSINGYDGEKILLSLPETGRQCCLIIK
jgi:hypothetical protein